MSVSACIDDSPLATIRRVLADNGCDPGQAAEYAQLICQEFVGEDVYFAAKKWQTPVDRDEQICAAARAGRSIRALAKDFCMSKTRIQEIIAARRAV